MEPEYAAQVEVPNETLEDTNYVPRPPPPPKGERAADPDLPGRDELQRQIKRLTRTAEESKTRAQTAEEALAATQRRASDEIGRARQETVQTRRTAVETSRVALETAVSENETALTSAKASFKQAYDSGDGDALAEAQARISELTVTKFENKRRLESLPTKEALEADEQTVGRPKDPAKMSPQERFEAYVEQFNPKSQSWLRKNPTFVTDPRLNRKLLRVHQEATEDNGLEAETEEYFNYIDERLGLAQADDDVFENDEPNLRSDPFDDGGRREQPQRQERNVQRNNRGTIEQNGSSRGARQFTDNRNNRPMRSAPVRGGSDVGSVRGTGGKFVGLTEGEIEQATDGTLTWNQDDPNGRFKAGDPIGTTEFARRKALMQRAGRYKNTDV